MKKYYIGSCEACHNDFINLTRWQMIIAYIKHKHLIYSLIHSNAVFFVQDSGYIDIQELMDNG